jgi:hypothetical protein
MGWETRWREMILAGGTVAVAACSSKPTLNVCGNGNGDPCCEYKNYGSQHGPQPTAECKVELGCEAEGGTYEPIDNNSTWGCNFSGDAMVPDAGPVFGSDVGPDATPDSEPSDAGGG